MLHRQHVKPRKKQFKADRRAMKLLFTVHMCMGEPLFVKSLSNTLHKQDKRDCCFQLFLFKWKQHLCNQIVNYFILYSHLFLWKEKTFFHSTFETFHHRILPIYRGKLESSQEENLLTVTTYKEIPLGSGIPGNQTIGDWENI